MDARHKYLMEQLANALNLDSGAIEEFMVSDDRVRAANTGGMYKQCSIIIAYINQTFRFKMSLKFLH